MGVGIVFLRLPNRVRNWPIVLGALLVVLGILFGRYIPYPVMHSGLLAPAFALLIFGFATQPPWTSLLAANPLILLGEASYSLYLLHSFFIVMALVLFGRSPHLALVTVVTILVAIFASLVVYFLLEKPLRRRLHPRYATPLVPTSASVIS